MSKYRSAQGKTIDMSILATQNEKTRAVGNMNVNARGDTIDSNNRVITDATKRINRTYNKTVQQKSAPNPDAPIVAGYDPIVEALKNKSSVPEVPPHMRGPAKKTIEPDTLSEAEQEFFDDDEDVEK